MKNSEESQRTQAILEEFKEKRGASLMDRHVAKKADQPKPAPGGRRAFDRELVSYITLTNRRNKMPSFFYQRLSCVQIAVPSL